MRLPPGERLVWRGHPSARSHLWWFVQWGIIALLPVTFAAIMRATDRDIAISLAWWAVLSACLLVLMAAFDTLRRAMTDYVVTDRQVRLRRGVIARGDQAADLSAVRSITARRSGMDRALGIGDVVIEVEDGDGTAALAFVGVTRPDQVAQRIDQYRDAANHSHKQ